ncbi:hypothetical protein [Ahniella affigens]|nr:hypothetical protein [Ahniella affigens]
MNEYTKWNQFVESKPLLMRGNREDELWREFKSENGFKPDDFEVRPPWCIAGAEDNEWATQAFLGDRRRQAAWALAGYLDRPFDFAYLWLDLACFNGLLKHSRLPYTAQRTTGALKREAKQYAKALTKVNDELSSWPFRGILGIGDLLRNSDYQNSVTLPAKAAKYSPEQTHIAVQLMIAGARQQIELPLAGSDSLLTRAAATLLNWEPPKSFIDRPNKPGAKPRYAARLLDHVLGQHGGAMPAPARLRLIAELVQILNELGEWNEDPWTEEQVRRCLDGKSKAPR